MTQEFPATIETGLEIAVIGMAGRFPGADDLATFWDNLRHGVESIRPISDQTLAAAGVDQTLREHPRYVKAGAFVRGIEDFDAAFFDYSPREAQLMDPQFRLLHECVWEALEDAGCSPATCAEQGHMIGLYAGASNNVYWIGRAMQHVASPSDIFQVMLLNDQNFTTRI